MIKLFLLTAFCLGLQISSPALAQSERYGSWTVEPLGKGFIAHTTNSSGSFFGMMCADKCYNIFNPQIQCEKGAKYPALINSSAGAYGVNLTCVHFEDRYLMTMDFVDTMYNAMEIGGELGIAFPMASGKFQVVRFSLIGALKASVRAFELSAAGQDEQGEDGLKDQIL